MIEVTPVLNHEHCFNVKCSGTPIELISELSIIINSVIRQSSGLGNNCYNTGLVEIWGSLLNSAINNKTSPIWKGILTTDEEWETD